ncbi:hypothetical protein [Lentzea albida]|uniref:Tetratricopeptide repeat-containing protein n=1 Tax=Lentzea albida TaxID=65499 RepID=A0A1H9DZ21_9PSEU|nr:hypothetical protein [Lentzea albida]SEQ17948.1 hypothetical protein SAMN04488000_10277 [Lentzea albida]
MRSSTLDRAIRDALALIRATSGHDLGEQTERARKCLAQAVMDSPDAPQRALAHVAAADEHLEYGELMEARTLLTAARSFLPGARAVVPARA